MRIKLLYISFFIIYVFIFCSCVTTNKATPIKKYVKLNNTNRQLIEGVYQLKDTPSFIIWLSTLGKYKGSLNIPIGDKLEVKIFDKQYFTFKLLQHSLVLHQKNIKGRIENGYLRFKVKQLTGFPPLFWGIINRRNHLYINLDGDLFLDCRSLRSAFFVILPLKNVSSENSIITSKKIN